MTRGHRGAVGRSAAVGDRRVERVLPKVIGLPPDGLVEEVGFSPVMHSCRGQDGVLQLLVLPAHRWRTREEPPLGTYSQVCWSASAQRRIGRSVSAGRKRWGRMRV
jgi:hypothetical protein